MMKYHTIYYNHHKSCFQCCQHLRFFSLKDIEVSSNKFFLNGYIDIYSYIPQECKLCIKLVSRRANHISYFETSWWVYVQQQNLFAGASCCAELNSQWKKQLVFFVGLTTDVLARSYWKSNITFKKKKTSISLQE